MAFRYYWVAGLAAVGVFGCLFLPKKAPPAVENMALAELALPDMDTDGKPERLRIMPSGDGMLMVLLDATRGLKSHEVMKVPGRGPLHFDALPGLWRLAPESGPALAEVKLFQQEKVLTPELVVTSANQGKRYLFIERGFMKLDAHEIIPGFSVGLLMVGDPAQLLARLGRPPELDGSWQLPLEQPLGYTLQFDKDHRITRMTVSSDRFAIRDSLKVGAPVAQMASRFPGKQEASRYVAPRYGLIGHLTDENRIEAMSITRPWREEKP